jgi:hypothetical protein
MRRFGSALRIPQYEQRDLSQQRGIVMKEPYRVWKMSLFAGVAALGTNLCLAQTPGAKPTPTVRSISGLVGITIDQGARLTAVNASNQPEIVKLALLDAAGKTVKASAVTLQPGEAGFLDVSYADDTDAAVAATRLELYGVVDTLPAVQNSAYPPDPCIGTLEVIAADGHTIVMNPNFRIHELNPQPLPP